MKPLLLLPPLLLSGGLTTQTAPPLFSDAERARLVLFWNTPGRVQVLPPEKAFKDGPWQVRLTPDGSEWLLKYQIAVGQARIPPTQEAKGLTGPAEAWEKWVAAKLEHDRWAAQNLADQANAVVRAPDLKPRAPEPPAPGVIPPDLLAKAGNPPPFVRLVTPLRWQVALEDGVYEYPDNVLMRPRYAYYRFPQGTVAYGPMLRDMADAELDPLFAAAGFTPSEARIAKAVSKLEGGFETVNTYDTGYVSIGFIQFVTLKDGKHSLSEVMAQERRDDPAAYAADFRDFGVDVEKDLTLTVVDPGTGAELRGPDAVLKVVAEPRFAAVFQRAGRRSRAFRVAQIKVAKAHYWPAEDAVKITVDGRTLSGKVSDVVKSEAGLATLFDRKVNRGSIAPFLEVLAQIMAKHGLNDLKSAARHEREIVAALKYRTDFLADTTLTQPDQK